jgi:hypothetical protein
MAIEDTLYALERAFQSGVLEADVYLKQVRAGGAAFNVFAERCRMRLCAAAMR